MLSHTAGRLSLVDAQMSPQKRRRRRQELDQASPYVPAFNNLAETAQAANPASLLDLEQLFR
jgi:hypothetical protein